MPPEGRYTTKSQIRNRSLPYLSVKVRRKQWDVTDTNVAIIHSSKQKLGQHETHRKWYQVTLWITHPLKLYLHRHLHTYLYLLNYSFDGGGTAYHFGASELTPIFPWVHIAQSLVFCVVLCRPRFVILSFFF